MPNVCVSVTSGFKAWHYLPPAEHGTVLTVDDK